MHLALLLAIVGPAQTAFHHQGFFLRMDLDAGYYASSPGSTTFSGAGGGFGISVGAGVARDMALFASVFGGAVTDANVSVGSVTQRVSGVSSAISGFGAGFTYYFMPVNVFISGTLGVAQASADQAGRSHPSRFGPVVRVGGGREWMVSDAWGLGVAAYLLYANNATEEYPQATWNTVAPLLAFSATFY